MIKYIEIDSQITYYLIDSLFIEYGNIVCRVAILYNLSSKQYRLIEQTEFIRRFAKVDNSIIFNQSSLWH